MCKKSLALSESYVKETRNFSRVPGIGAENPVLVREPATRAPLVSAFRSSRKKFFFCLWTPPGTDLFSPGVERAAAGSRNFRSFAAQVSDTFEEFPEEE